MEINTGHGKLLSMTAGVLIMVAVWCMILSGCGKKEEKNPVSSSDPVTDIDGNVYQTVKIGDQLWMVENLKVTRYRNGDVIPNITDNTEWNNLSTGACSSYDNLTRNSSTYGYLYNWHSVNDSRNIAPAGWHVPADEEWKELEMVLGMSRQEADETEWRGTNEGGKLKEAGNSHWQSPNRNATNETGFSAIPGGFRYDYGGFNSFGYYAYFWSSTEVDPVNAWFRYLGYGDSYVFRFGCDKRYGFSVRCVQD